MAAERPPFSPDRLEPIGDWLRHYRRIWKRRLDRLEDYLREMQGKTGFTDKGKDDVRKR